MRPGGGKLKGGAFERHVCKQLSLWISQGAREDIFWRSAMSGGRATVRNRRGQKTQNQWGDVTALAHTPEDGPSLTDLFIIECKHINNAGLLNSLINLSTTAPLATHWQKLTALCDSVGRMPMLIIKQNRIKTLVCLCPKGKDKLMRFAGHHVHSDFLNMYIFPSDYFFDWAVIPK